MSTFLAALANLDGRVMRNVTISLYYFTSAPCRPNHIWQGWRLWITLTCVLVMVVVVVVVVFFLIFYDDFPSQKWWWWQKCSWFQLKKKRFSVHFVWYRSLVTPCSYITGGSKTGNVETDFPTNAVLLKWQGWFQTTYFYQEKIYSSLREIYKHYRQCTYNITLRHVRATTVAIEKQ